MLKIRVEGIARITFLSIQAQDFIEERSFRILPLVLVQFLSIQAQDFIEDVRRPIIFRKRRHS